MSAFRGRAYERANIAAKIILIVVILFYASEYFTSSSVARTPGLPREEESRPVSQVKPKDFPPTTTTTTKSSSPATQSRQERIGPPAHKPHLPTAINNTTPNLDTIYQIPDENVFLIRPFYDDRFGQRKIRFFGMQEQSSKVPLTCIFKLLDNSKYKYYVVDIERRALFPWWPDIKGKIQSYSYDCFLGKTSVDLTEVSVGVKGQDTHLSIPIAETVEEKGSELALCLKCTHGVVNATRLIEWIEFNRLLGVGKFVVYDTAIHGPAKRVLRYYESQGIVEVIPYHYPLSIIKFARDLYGNLNEESEKILWEQAFLVCLNDCVYRYRKAHRFISVVDMDELIIPVNKSESLLDMCHRGERTFPRVQALRFDTSWHAEHYGTPPGAPSICYTQNHIRRTPVTPLQPKAIHKTDSVLAVNWHGPCEDYPKHMNIPLQACVNEKDWGHTHHFRRCHDYEICMTYNKNNTVDTEVPRYKQQLETRVRPVYEKLRFLKSSRYQKVGKR